MRHIVPILIVSVLACYGGVCGINTCLELSALHAPGQHEVQHASHTVKNPPSAHAQNHSAPHQKEPLSTPLATYRIPSNDHTICCTNVLNNDPSPLLTKKLPISSPIAFIHFPDGRIHGQNVTTTFLYPDSKPKPTSLFIAKSSLRL